MAGIRSPADKPAEPPINQSLRVSWPQWRGPAIVKFEPRVVRVADGKASTSVTFDKPGRYVLRAFAEDASIHTPHDVEVTVVAGTAAPQH